MEGETGEKISIEPLRCESPVCLLVKERRELREHEIAKILCLGEDPKHTEQDDEDNDNAPDNLE